jgi:hypothetical protein
MVLLALIALSILFAILNCQFKSDKLLMNH